MLVSMSTENLNVILRLEPFKVRTQVGTPMSPNCKLLLRGRVPGEVQTLACDVKENKSPQSS